MSVFTGRMSFMMSLDWLSDSVIALTFTTVFRASSIGSYKGPVSSKSVSFRYSNELQHSLRKPKFFICVAVIIYGKPPSNVCRLLMFCSTSLTTVDMAMAALCVGHSSRCQRMTLRCLLILIHRLFVNRISDFTSRQWLNAVFKCSVDQVK